MWYYQIETENYFDVTASLRGGVAPGRHELTLHNYREVQKRNQLIESRSITPQLEIDAIWSTLNSFVETLRQRLKRKLHWV